MLEAHAAKLLPSKGNTERSSSTHLVSRLLLLAQLAFLDLDIRVVVAAQNFEYKMSNILDKPLYVWFNLLSVHLTPLS
jgi:hypothetical protein